ncbi:Vitamin B12 ABC transporter, permease component BtuC [Thermogutta terrifontis]|uniref:Vitamin B12 ABC transporter, permease component BtuC n=1 Tax=Thermogutta terrifontis TaxID=1331910 RepID=A0A286RJ26_9BACT|nr:iron ABC transporter permease [Thermogutta terrifontis]ASV75971.1 Vitamin B12 ABC transporter, permease component BtuC [Thermogutta terrifontis]
MKPGRSALVIIALGTLVVLSVAPLAGPRWIDPCILWKGENPLEARILWDIRIPRVLVGFLAGMGLAVGGTAYQAMFRNPLASPFTLGLASGASLGAVLAIHLGWTKLLWGTPAVTLCALMGAGTTLVVVYGLTRLRAELSVATMLLAGVAMSFLNTSLILMLQYAVDPVRAFHAFRWMLGGLEGTLGYRDVLWLAPVVVAGSFILWVLRRELNLLSLGDEWAAARGVSLPTVKTLILFVTGLMVASIVAHCGPIGFVCLIAPHISRQLVGPQHTRLVPAAALLGGAFLVISDTVARTILAPAEIPVGVITAILGGPFFLWLLLTRPLSWEWVP